MKNKNTITLDKIFLNKLTGEWGKECQVGKKGIKVLRTTNFTNTGIINYSNVIEREIPNKKVTEKKLIYGDIILEKSGGSDNQPVGRVVYYDKKNEQYLCNNFTQILRTNGNIAYSRYIFYFMFNLHKSGATKLLQNKTTGIRNLQVKKYMNTEIQLPHINIQKKISNTLDKVTNLINLRKQQLEKLDLLIKSKFFDMFGDPLTNSKKWEISSLEKHCVFKSGGTPSRKKKKYFLGTIPWITTVSLGKNKINDEDAIALITKDAISNSSTTIIEPNSLLFGVRVGVGKISINTVPMCTSQDIVAITNINKKNFNIVYLKKTLETFSQYFNEQKRGATIKGITINTLKSTFIPIPPIKLQNQFAEFIEEIEKQKLLINKSLEKFELLYKSLMQKYFENTNG
ncbi:MAG: restriction endonuclease subunit S [Endomicrobiaceae bacterium]